MKREGIGNYLIKSPFKTFKDGLLTGVLFYGIDALFGINDSSINLHDVYFYGYGSLRYLAALSNTFKAMELESASYIPGIPVYLFLKAMKAVKVVKGGDYEGI